MKTVLLVDDEEPLLLSLKEGLKAYAQQFQVLTAANGEEAQAAIANAPVDLVVTDLRMPKMDGFELLAWMNSQHPHIPSIVMTAFNTPEIERKLAKENPLRLIDKPIDFDELTESITEILSHIGKEGALKGFSLANFLQLIRLESKTCLLEITTPKDEKGLFYFFKGDLFDAVFGDMRGDEAAYEMLARENLSIGFRTLPKKKFKKRIHRDLMSILMEGLRRLDEKNAPDLAEDSDAAPPEASPPAEVEAPSQERQPASPSADGPATDANEIPIAFKGDERMATLKEVLERFKDIDGFRAVGVFTPQGEMAAEFNVSGEKLGELGALANDVLLKAQKTTEVMGVGRGNMVHIEAPKAQVIARCFNEATDFTATASGRAHIHMVLIMEKEGSLAMGKMKLESIIQEIAPSFR